MATAPMEPSIAKKIGEGMERPNADKELPLDINYQKIVDWLVKGLCKWALWVSKNANANDAWGSWDRG